MISEIEAPNLWDREIVEARVREITEAGTENFVELLHIAGLDPNRDLRFTDWSGVDFSGCDLVGFDFTGANLKGCLFEGARIAGARFDAAQVDRRSLLRAKDWSEYVRTWSRLPKPPTDRHLPDFAVFSEAPFASEMVVLPMGKFIMGSPEDDKDSSDDERPQHQVTIDYRLAMGRYPVTFDEYDYFCVAVRREKPNDLWWGRGRRPVINVSWEDAKAYVDWLSKETLLAYRLPSEAEWEYACRAGTTTRYAVGHEISERHANFGSEFDMTTEVGSYPANPWGLYDMHGNVWEWVGDVWHNNYQGAPGDGAAWLTKKGKYPGRIDRGGSWDVLRRELRSAYRDWNQPDKRDDYLGFRLARTLSS